MIYLNYFGKGFNYSQDGPGNRLVYHLQGCNFKCPWCSNPEGMKIGRESIIESADDIVKYVVSCRPMFFDKGGITFSGGEPSLQYKQVYEIMKSVRKFNINTAIESNASGKGITKLIDVCDYFMIDFKSPFKDKLKLVTDGNIEEIKKNISVILKSKPVHFHIPLVHAFNDSPEDINGFLDYFKEIRKSGGHFDIEILPYHEYGKEKWKKAGLTYTVKDGFVSSQTVRYFKEVLVKNSFKLIKT